MRNILFQVAHSAKKYDIAHSALLPLTPQLNAYGFHAVHNIVSGSLRPLLLRDIYCHGVILFYSLKLNTYKLRQVVKLRRRNNQMFKMYVYNCFLGFS